LVDNNPIRIFKNAESIGIPFPKNQPMRIYSSLWNADDWATRGGLVKTDWSKAPFTAYYRNFKATELSSVSSTSFSDSALQSNELDAYGRRRLRWVQKYFMIYNYCNDLKRFPQGIPAECKRPRFWEINDEEHIIAILFYNTTVLSNVFVCHCFNLLWFFDFIIFSSIFLVSILDNTWSNKSNSLYHLLVFVILRTLYIPCSDLMGLNDAYRT